MTPTTSAMTPARARCTSGTETARCARSTPRQAPLRAISGSPDIRNPSSWRRAGRGSSSTCPRRTTSRWWIAQNTRLSQLGTFPARNPIIRWRSMSRAGGCSSEHASPRCCWYTTSIPERSWRSWRSGKTPTTSSSTRSASAFTSSADRGGSTSCGRRIRIVTRWNAQSARPPARAPGSSFQKKDCSTWPRRQSEHPPRSCSLIGFVESTKRFVTRTRHGARFAPHLEKEYIMKCKERWYFQVLPLVTAFVVAGSLGWQPARAEGDSKELQAVAQALGKSKLSLLAGIRQASQGSAKAISAKFELEDGKLSLSVYTAEKGLAVPAEKNVLQELSGSPEQDKWAPKTEVFKDVPHVARSAEQLAVMSLGRKSLAAIIAEVRKTHPGTVFSITPTIRNHKPVAVVLVAQKGKVTTVTQPL